MVDEKSCNEKFRRYSNFYY